jgi:hypothetical protein
MDRRTFLGAEAQQATGSDRLAYLSTLDVRYPGEHYSRLGSFQCPVCQFSRVTS